MITPEPEIVLGPPGTGKTTTLLGEVEAELAAGVAPDRVGYLSFTRRAAEEARTRAQVRFGLSKRQLPYFRTIHSLCFAALGLSSSDVLEGARLVEFGDWIGVKVTGRGAPEEGALFGFEVGDRCLHLENLARVRCVSLREQYDAGDDGLPWPLVDRVARGLAEFKRAQHLVDYTDMLRMFVDGTWSARLEVLLVDEIQDLSALQWLVVEHLARGVRRLVVAGDDDQAVYRWAGAAVEHFVNLPGRVRVLEQSWRVPHAAQEVALGALARIRTRRTKLWLPRPGDAGEVVRVNSLDEVDFGAGDDVLVLARNSCFLRDDASRLLESEGVLYEWRGHSSVRATVIGAIVDWEHLRRGDAVRVSDVAHVYEYMAAGAGYARGHKKLPHWQDRDATVTLADLREHGGLLTDAIWHDALARILPEERAYMLKALRRGESLRRPTVRLSTIHGAKGGQARHVVLMRDMAYRSWREMDLWPEDEARTFYVGATRAMERLTIVAPQGRRGYDV